MLPIKKTGCLFPANDRPILNEKLLQYIWSNQSFDCNDLLSTGGDALSIINPGKINFNQGPDFQGARVKVGHTLFAGTIELHLKTSLWKAHGHDEDRNYNSVILHVVWENDLQQRSIVPILELSGRVSARVLEKYRQLMYSPFSIPCGSGIGSVRKVTLQSWFDRLLFQRLVRNSDLILALYKENNRWEETFWWLLARNFGFKVNRESFEAIARAIPIHQLLAIKEDRQAIEALLFGTSGLLDAPLITDFAKALRNNYRRLRKRLKIVPIIQPIHFLRMRPQNFPTVRLAQLAALIPVFPQLYEAIFKASEINHIQLLLDISAGIEWDYRYRLDEETSYHPKNLGKEMINNLMINTILPFLFSYGKFHKDDMLQQKSVDWMHKLPPEHNSIIRGFEQLKVDPGTAGETQSLLELKALYCDQKRCLECAVGVSLLGANSIQDQVPQSTLIAMSG